MTPAYCRWYDGAHACGQPTQDPAFPRYDSILVAPNPLQENGRFGTTATSNERRDADRTVPVRAGYAGNVRYSVALPHGMRLRVSAEAGQPWCERAVRRCVHRRICRRYAAISAADYRGRRFAARRHLSIDRAGRKLSSDVGERKGGPAGPPFSFVAPSGISEDPCDPEPQASDSASVSSSRPQPGRHPAMCT